MLKRALTSLNNSIKMAAPLTHPCIENGWFMEKSTMWPGQGKNTTCFCFILRESS
jgi:hypothetical protein